MKKNALVVFGKGKKAWEELISHIEKKKVNVHRAYSSTKSFIALKNKPVNVIIADYLLFKTIPLGFMEKIKAIKPHVEVIFLSESLSFAKAIEAMKAGAYDFYEFPVNNGLIMSAINEAIKKQSILYEKLEVEQKLKKLISFGNISARGKAMKHVINVLASVVAKDVSILLTGETGTGKEMIANAIHYNSPRNSKPFIKVNCAAYNEGVLESELFGHEKGAFTGAMTKRIGRFELADKGIIFLDEIGDISLSTQVKLLRVLQEKEFERVGGNETIKINVRVIAATHQDLRRLIEEGKFREDLFYRLNVVNIELPPLRERTEDIPQLVGNLITKLNKVEGFGIKGITKEAMQILLNYQWPGNVRELINALETGMALSRKDIIEAKYLPSSLLLLEPHHSEFYHIPQDLTLPEIQREIIRLTLQKTKGNKTLASKLLGIGLRTVQRKLKEM